MTAQPDSVVLQIKLLQLKVILLENWKRQNVVAPNKTNFHLTNQLKTSQERTKYGNKIGNVNKSVALNCNMIDIPNKGSSLSNKSFPISQDISHRSISEWIRQLDSYFYIHRTN